jgi:succinoglycan biosynthesis protein ExoM
MVEVSIVIPTFRRPVLLDRALKSCIRQEDFAPEHYEIVVVDNCPDGSAGDCARAAAGSSPVAILYAHEPRPGISWARNAGLRKSSGRFVAFIDDDEVACADWLRRLLDAQAEHHADVVLGPVLPDLKVEPGDPRQAFFRDYFTYAVNRPTGTEIGSGALTPFWSRGTKAYPRLASGNSLIRREAIGDVMFDPALGLTGGEDTVFFNRLLADGARIVYCAEAVAKEEVPEERLCMDYVLQRAFRGGQITSRAPLLLRRRRPLMTVLSMVLGAAQLAIHLPAALATAALRAPHRFHHSVGAATALGKLLWMAPFRRTAYGATAATLLKATPLETKRMAR